MPKKRIESLTPHQTARMAEFRDKWTAIGLSTAPADRPKAEAAIHKMYAAAGLKAPKKIVWCGSPLSQGLTKAIVTDGSFAASVGASVRASGYGQHDAGWLAFYSFFREVCGLASETAKLDSLTEQAQAAGWYLPHEHICWVSERHTTLHRDERGRLHCLTGPACAYPDGFAIHAVHGVRVPADIIEKPASITVARIDSEKNAEVRRVMVDRYGQARFLVDGGAKIVATDDYGTLYRRELPGDEPIVMVKVVNSTPEPDGSFKDYFIRVPPTVTTAREAVAWSFAKTADEYAPSVQT